MWVVDLSDCSRGSGVYAKREQDAVPGVAQSAPGLLTAGGNMTGKEKEFSAPRAAVNKFALKSIDSASAQLARLIKDLNTMLEAAAKLSLILDEERVKYAPPAANGIH
jgi:hypothetical protein